MDEKTIAYGALKRRFGWEFDGMVLHELYFENLGGKQPLSPKSRLYRKIVENFASFENWRQNFFATEIIRGIGWVILYQDPADGQLHNIWVDEHNIMRHTSSYHGCVGACLSYRVWSQSRRVY
uniref:Fe-Mn family superoxide dismutase n=1 Tax=Candidatus Neptunichlamydia sp. REUL1 TaxID=3064277 RepID=UPI00292F89DA|nr:Fe-Mn family superoxide dismutase [Candidatus Neptunochlamydia sp. REUL1]